MNILIPHTWLLEHLDTDADPKKIQETLSLCGPSVERIEELEGEPVYDIEVTTNRVDSASVRGIAREAATILPEFHIDAKLKEISFDPIENKDKLDITIQNDPSLCKRILAVKMSVSKVTDSPDWMKKRLLQVGQRPLNNIIDITNYIMWEIGHPIHVFDYQKITSKKIVVRQAREGETFVTLDGKKHTCNGGEVVFDDGTGNIIDLPSIMGAQNTMVDDTTTEILVWVESVHAHLVRAASMGLAIRSHAAVLNEKHVDPTLGKEAIIRAGSLYQEICGGQYQSSLYDDWPEPVTTSPIDLTQAHLDTYLGVQIDSDRVTRILTELGCEVSYDANSKRYTVIPPSFRAHDIEIYQDLIEEIARIYGYHNLPSILPDTPIPDIDTNIDHVKESQAKHALAMMGANEVYSYSLISSQMASESGFQAHEHIALANPLSEELMYLRKNFVSSHKQIFDSNKVQRNWSIFEMANSYHTEDIGLPNEVLTLALSNNDSYSAVKQLVSQLLKTLYCKNIRFTALDTAVPGFTMNNATIFVDSTEIGTIGESIHGFYHAQINWSTLLDASNPHPTYTQLVKYSAIVEDLTFTLPEKTYLGDLVEAITAVSECIESVSIKDTYKQNVTINLSYLNSDKQITTGDVEEVRKEIVRTVASNFKGSLVGEI